MSDIAKTPSRIKKGYGKSIAIDRIEDHSQDPVVLKKLAKAIETMNKVGLPLQGK